MTQWKLLFIHTYIYKINYIIYNKVYHFIPGSEKYLWFENPLQWCRHTLESVLNHEYSSLLYMIVKKQICISTKLWKITSKSSRISKTGFLYIEVCVSHDTVLITVQVKRSTGFCQNQLQLILKISLNCEHSRPRKLSVHTSSWISGSNLIFISLSWMQVWCCAFRRPPVNVFGDRFNGWLNKALGTRDVGAKSFPVH